MFVFILAMRERIQCGKITIKGYLIGANATHFKISFTA